MQQHPHQAHRAAYAQQPYAHPQQHAYPQQQQAYAPQPAYPQQHAATPGNPNALVASTGSWARAAGIMHLVLGLPALAAGALFVGGAMGTIQFVVGAGFAAVGFSLLTASSSLGKAAKAQTPDPTQTIHALASYRFAGMAQVGMLAALAVLTMLVLVGGYR